MGERIERVVGLVSDTAIGRFGHRPYTRVRILTYPSSSLRRFLPSWWISKYYRTMNSIMILWDHNSARGLSVDFSPRGNSKSRTQVILTCTENIKQSRDKGALSEADPSPASLRPRRPKPRAKACQQSTRTHTVKWGRIVLPRGSKVGMMMRPTSSPKKLGERWVHQISQRDNHVARGPS